MAIGATRNQVKDTHEMIFMDADKRASYMRT
jgi:hypothetical protein